MLHQGDLSSAGQLHDRIDSGSRRICNRAGERDFRGSSGFDLQMDIRALDVVWYAQVPTKQRSRPLCFDHVPRVPPALI